MKERDEELGRRAKALFDESVDGLDAASLSHLNRGRQAALAELSRRRQQWVRWMPAAGATVAVLIAILVLAPQQQAPEVPIAVADMEILLGEDDIDMLEELEFYSWIDIAEQDDDVG
jgi:hypothetical protein